MRLSIFLVAIALTARALAAEQTFTITPAAWQDWSISGADKAVLVAAPTLTLPAGAQASRQFVAGAVILHLATRPNFSERPADWPVLSVGPAALALVRKEGEGRLMLIVDESTTKELPWSVQPDDATTMDLFIAYDPIAGTGIIGLDDRRQTFSLPRSAKPVEVWLSAGSQAPWEQERMEIMLLSDDPVATSSRSRDRKPDANDSTGKLGSALERLRHESGYGETAAATTAGSASGQIPASLASGLEVFTPPSVRRARVIDAIRAVTEPNPHK